MDDDLPYCCPSHQIKTYILHITGPTPTTLCLLTIKRYIYIYFFFNGAEIGLISGYFH